MAPGLVEALELTPAQILIVLASRESADATPSAAAPVQKMGNPEDFLALIGGGPAVEVIHE